MLCPTITNGRFNIFWGDSFSRGSITNAKGTYGYYIWEDGVRQNAAVSSRNQGFYFQDSWRIHSRVTLNLGVRLENEFLPPYRKEQNGVKIANPVAFGWTDKIAPRLGAAWDVRGDGRWKVSASFGYYYDVMKYELARGSFGGDYWVSHVYLLDSPNVLSLGKANPGALGKEIVSYDNRTVPINAQGELDGIDPNIKPFKATPAQFRGGPLIFLAAGGECALYPNRPSGRYRGHRYREWRRRSIFDRQPRFRRNPQSEISMGSEIPEWEGMAGSGSDPPVRRSRVPLPGSHQGLQLLGFVHL